MAREPPVQYVWITGDQSDIHSFLLELDDRGLMNREIGYDQRGKPVHIGGGGQQHRGYFDVSPVFGEPSNLSFRHFQDRWEEAVAVLQSIRPLW